MGVDGARAARHRRRCGLDVLRPEPSVATQCRPPWTATTLPRHSVARAYLGADLEGATGRALSPAGVVEISVAKLGASIRLSADVDSIVFSAGPRIAAGLAWVSGRSPTGADATGSGPVILVGGALQVDVLVAGAFFLRFGTEVSGAVLGFDARADAMPVSGASGASIALYTGVAVAP